MASYLGPGPRVKDDVCFGRQLGEAPAARLLQLDADAGRGQVDAQQAHAGQSRLWDAALAETGG